MTTTSRPSGRPFEAGNKGRPRGARNKTTLAIEAMFEGEAEAISRKLIEAALDGDMTAIKLVMERVSPVPKGSRITADLADIDFAGDPDKAMNGVVAAMLRGDLTSTEVEVLVKVVETRRRLIETVDLENRLRKLEAKDGQ